MNVYSPVNPIITWTVEATAIAPCTSLIRIFHTSSISEDDMFEYVISLHGSKLVVRIAMVGTRKLKVPPWMIGNLQTEKKHVQNQKHVDVKRIIGKLHKYLT